MVEIAAKRHLAMLVPLTAVALAVSGMVFRPVILPPEPAFAERWRERVGELPADGGGAGAAALPFPRPVHTIPYRE